MNQGVGVELTISSEELHLTQGEDSWLVLEVPHSDREETAPFRFITFETEGAGKLCQATGTNAIIGVHGRWGNAVDNNVESNQSIG